MPPGNQAIQSIPGEAAYGIAIGIGVSDAASAHQMEVLLRDLRATANTLIFICGSSDLDLMRHRSALSLESEPHPQGEQIVSPVARMVYVVPNDQVLETTDSALRIGGAQDEEARHSRLDSFFYALAQWHKAHVIAVLLGNRGTDGILGLREICEHGGLTILERPSGSNLSTSKEALASDEIDYVVPIDEMPRILRKCLTFNEDQAGTNDDSSKRRGIIESIPVIAEILREQTNHNFKDYKTSTLVRRIERRMKIHRTTSIDEYVGMLKDSEDERSSLFRDLLISVTAFFRDANAFESIARNVLPELIVEGRQEPVRIWVPGCATGQEAYSMAILCDEFASTLKRPPEIQILATDIDSRALGIARKGIYPSGISLQLSPERLERYFVRKAGRFHVANSIREKCLFSIHNLISDPPYAKLDLISCRNILIYLGVHLQIKLIPLFHFAMQPDGFLLLGPSESLSGNRELFTEVDLRNRLWRRKKTAIDAPSLLKDPATSIQAAPLPSQHSRSDKDLQDLGQRIILGEFSPEWAIVAEDSQVLSVSQGIDQFFRISGGTFRNNIVDLVRPDLKTALRATLSDSMRVHRRIDHGNVSIRVQDGLQRICITVQPMPQMGTESALYMVVFHKEGAILSASEAEAQPALNASNSLIQQLERELASTREDLEKSVQELEAANEELKSFNEELLSMNEELQSANEELEASRAEVSRTNLSLIDAREEVENLLASTNIATIFLDRKGNVKNFTAAAIEIYNLIDSDVGRPLWHLTHRMADMPPIPRIDSVENGIFTDVVVMREDYHWFNRQVLPYRSREGRIDGIVLTFSDITELRANEAKTRTALDAGNMGIWHWDAGGRSFRFDGRSRSLLNLDESQDEEVPESQVILRLLPDYREALQNRLQEAVAAQSTESFREDVATRNGESGVRWIAFVGSIDRSKGNGTSRDVTGVLLDFSERKQTELRLREREQFARAVIENSPDCFKVLDADGHLVMMNRRGCQLMEIDDFSTVVGKRWSSLWPEESQKTVAAAVDSARNGQSAKFRATCCTAKGAHKYWDVSVVGVPDPSGNVSQIISVSRDVTDERVAELRTSETAERLQSAIEVAGLGTVIVDYDEDTAEIDSNAAEILGLERAVTISRAAFHDLFVPEDRNHLNQLAEQALVSRDVTGFSTEARIITAQGLRVVNVRKRNSFAINGTLSRGLIALQDVTERKNYEISLQTARNIAEAATRSRGEFLANMSHEIRTPMTAILGHADILADNTTDPDNLQCVDTIRRNGRFLLEIINDILDLSRIDAGQLRLNRERTPLDRLLADIRSLMDVRAAEKNMNLTFEFPTLVPQEIETDSIRLRQVLLNLIGNAIKFTRAGSVRVETKYDPDSKQLSFAISDTGIGISEQNLRKLFAPFQQADDSTTREFGGTGLGLAISRRLARALKGDISVVSEAGVGSTFTLTMACIPCRNQQLIIPDLRMIQPPTAPPQSIELDAHVLIVDDRRDIRSLAQHFVEKAGGHVITATNGKEAVELLLGGTTEAAKIDIVLLDMQMPIMDGYEATRQLRKAGFDRPIIALTANAMKEDRDRCLDAGCTDYATKPLDAAMLISQIASLLDSDNQCDNDRE